MLIKKRQSIITTSLLGISFAYNLFFLPEELLAETYRVSVSSVGAQSNDSSGGSPSISADGRFVAFSSRASNLVPDDTNDIKDIFVHDRQTGETTRVSVNSAGEQGNHASIEASISDDGRFVAFWSFAKNLVSDDLNEYYDVFVRDRQTGETTIVSVSSAGIQGNNGSGTPSISGDGRFVAFNSFANNLVSDDTNDQSGIFVRDTFVHDRQTGETTRVSVSSAGVQGNDSSGGNPSISADGRFVAFSSWASNLVPDDTNDQTDIFVHDRQTGETTRVSVSSAGIQGNGESLWLSISADGRLVAFQSSSNNLVLDDSNGGYGDIFVHDRQTGETTIVSVNSAGVQSDRGGMNPFISADGRFVTFESNAFNLVPERLNIDGDLYVHDRQTGETTIESVSSAGTPGNAGSGSGFITGDGRFVAFISRADNLVPDDTNGFHDIFLRTRGLQSISPNTKSFIQYAGNNHWYRAFEDLATWGSAKFYCEALGGYLATLTSGEENNFVYTNLTNRNYNYWLGATDEINEGNWQWVTGEEWTYSNWAQNQPDDLPQGQDYLSFYSLYPNNWDDNGLPGFNDEFNFVCEWNDLDNYTNIVKNTDIDGSNFVDGIDLSIFAAAYGSSEGSGNYIPQADFNSDGFVNYVDLISFSHMIGTKYGDHAIVYTNGFDYPLSPPDAGGWTKTRIFGALVSEEYHLGEDWAKIEGETENESVYAIANGVVVHSEVGGGCWLHVMMIRHLLPDGRQFESLYGHLNSRNYEVGDIIQKGSEIGKIGNPYCGGPHLHFEIRTPDCPYWDNHTRGTGYSDIPEPLDWLDPSDFIDSNR